MNEQVTLTKYVQQPTVARRIDELLGERKAEYVTSLTALQTASPALRNCRPASVCAATLTAACMGLSCHPSLGEAYIIGYGQEATFQLGYRGLIQLAQNSGKYRSIRIIDVREGELEYNRLTGEAKLRKPTSDKVVGYLGYFELVNGFSQSEYWTIEKIEAHAKRFSQAYKSGKKDTPWATDFDAMAKKTVLKDLISKWGPRSMTMTQAITNDNTVKVAIDSEPVPVSDPAPPEETVVEQPPDKSMPVKRIEPVVLKPVKIADEVPEKPVAKPVARKGRPPKVISELKFFVENNESVTVEKLVEFAKEFNLVDADTAIERVDQFPEAVAVTLMQNAENIRDVGLPEMEEEGQ